MLGQLDIMERPDIGVVTRLEPGLRRVVAPNANPMTHWGTNTYILGEGRVAIIDPGPDDDGHMDAIRRSLGSETVSHILVTHAHRDHSAGARRLGRETGAPVYAFGSALAGRSEIMEKLAKQGLVGGGEGVDHGFVPDVTLVDGETVRDAGWSVTTIWTPGHFAGHLCFDWQGRVFSGDHVMGWASTIISPPDGDVTSFMSSCATLKRRQVLRFYPGHGAPIIDTDARLDWLMRHRREREDQILAALGHGSLDLKALTRRIYFDAPAVLFPAAERNVLAHLIDLETRRLVKAHPDISVSSKFSRA